ncbi:YtxH domain-containing protein [Myceligenerans pegani]|uniref:YtxH domain-containing protein n=1 Tax=Myceligenerans pegani TaxID=2776917 RepID=A0ABR9MX10_9MICO|nr:YtxH domain-containing protein [Myceligenerans sp. TRM 65318]MBE1875317.1 YtxH domain-containing protein [Myceligenerans sp. TRM 65318]MBE3017588.1 YtxH domain-containing protein [Myceligenerans sp. TRM 65318]
MSDPTVRFTPGMNPRPVRSGEPMTTLVFDQELVGRLQALHRGGFSIRAEQVIAEHLAKVGQHRAGGRTPHEIKQYIWQQMQWGDAGMPAAPNGDLHSLRQSVRANTEIIEPPGSIRPQPPAPEQSRPSGQFQQPGPHPQHGAPAPAAPPGGVPRGTPGPFPPGPSEGPGDRAPEGEPGASVLGEILAWIPRALLALSIYQLVRLIPGFDGMPDVSRWEPFRAIGDGVLGALNLNPDWSDQAANLTIPVLGLVLAALLNYITPLRRGRKLHVWPYMLVIAAWIAVFAVSGVTSFASDATENLRQDIQEQVDRTIEDETQQMQDDVEDAVGDQIDQMTDDASEAAKNTVEEQGQGGG